MKRAARIALGLLAVLGCTAWYGWSHPVSTLLFLANLPDEFGARVPVRADLAYGSDPLQRLDVYPSGAGGAGVPVVVYLHGGRWTTGDKAQYRFVALTLVRAGAVAVLPNYRLYPSVRMEPAMRDVATLVAYVQAHAREWGGDPSRVVLMGHSAGAHLGALAALDARWLAGAGAAPVQGLVGLAGTYDFLPLTDDDLKDYFGPPQAYPASQPINFVSARAPPAFLVQGLSDDSVKPRNTINLSRALRDAGVAVETHLVDREGHYDILKRFAAPWRGGDDVVAALARFLRAVPAAAPAAGPVS